MRKLLTLKKRTAKSICKRKVLRAIELFEANINEEIGGVMLINTTLFVVSTDDRRYRVDFTKNNVERVYDDPDW